MTELYLGLMSGTSADGVDAVLAEFVEGKFIGLRGTLHRDHSPALRQRLLDVSLQQPSMSLRAMCVLDRDVAEAFSAAAVELLESSGTRASQVAAIGSHGQTLFHDGPQSLTLQVGDPNLIAARTGITTVADFRRRDLALGGQGAPLVPAFHHALFARSGKNICVVNIGGIANVTLMLGIDADAVRGFDTGPGNGLMDEWMQLAAGQTFDRDGNFAAAGQPHAPLLDSLLSDPYFKELPPKSTGRDYFRLDWARQCFPGLAELSAQDVQATLCELTARSIAEAVTTRMVAIDRLLVCGGGARNRWLMMRLRALLQSSVETTDDVGLDAEWIEAAAFAWLAMRTMRGQSGSLPGVTGAARAAVLGGIYMSQR